MREIRNTYGVLVGKAKRKRPLGRVRRRWVDTNKIDLGENGWTVVHWIGLDKWRALVNAVITLRVP
jgi:hypothetical protein